MGAADLVVIGGGAAGMMAAGRAAELGLKVLLLEKTKTLGNKLRISGKGRCNLTNAEDIGDFIDKFPGNGKFLQSSFHRFTNWDLMDFFNQWGVPVKIERGNRVFPEADDAEAVIGALVRYMKDNGVTVRCGVEVREIVMDPAADSPKVKGVRLSDDSFVPVDHVLIATGGLSYPGTGSSGDGYSFARSAGHSVSRLLPALVPVKVEEKWVGELSGLSLRNVSAGVKLDGEITELEFGEMLFTHFGLSGPIVLTLSRRVSHGLADGKKVSLVVNLKPALTSEQLDQRLQRDFAKYSRKQFKNALDDLLPKKLVPVMVSLSGIDPAKFVHQITKEERLKLRELIQGLEFRVLGTLPISAAIVTAGGVAVDEVNPRTMESKLVTGLFFAGEVLDIDAVTGGYNLQAAFSTARRAAESIHR